MSDGDLRILGAADGYAHALGHLRCNILTPINGPYSAGIHPKHVRKLAARNAKLAPLLALEKWLIARHDETFAAYLKTK